MEDIGAYTRSLDPFFSIIQYSPLKCIQIANRWTLRHRQNYGKKIIMEKIIMEKKKVRNFSIIDRRRL